MTFVTVWRQLSNTDLIKANAAGNLSANAWTAFEMFSFNSLNFPVIHSFTCPAFSFIVSQFLYSKTPIVIIAAMAAIAIPMGLVRKANAAPSAVVTVVPMAHTAFQAVCAAVCAYVAAVLAPLTMVSFAYSA